MVSVFCEGGPEPRWGSTGFLVLTHGSPAVRATMGCGPESFQDSRGSEVGRNGCLRDDVCGADGCIQSGASRRSPQPGGEGWFDGEAG